MVNARAIRMVRVALILSVGVLSSCDYFASPIPGYLSVTESTRTLDVSGIVGDADPSEVDYDLEFVSNGVSEYLLLNVEPPNADPDGFENNGRILLLNPDGTLESTLEPGSQIDYLSRPYGFAFAGELLVGYSVFVPSVSGGPRQELPQHGLEGFFLAEPPGATPTSAHLFAAASGQFSSFHLEIRNYDFAATPDWSILAEAEFVEIVENGLSRSDDDAEVQLGYQLLGVSRDGAQVRFLLSRPSERIVIATSASLADIRAGLGRPLISESFPVDFSIDADRPRASADDEGFFLLRRNGWFERYDWNGDLVARVSGDTSFSRQYAFDVSGDRFYQYDPDTSVLTTYSGWW